VFEERCDAQRAGDDAEYSAIVRLSVHIPNGVEVTMSFMRSNRKGRKAATVARIARCLSSRQYRIGAVFNEDHRRIVGLPQFRTLMLQSQAGSDRGLLADVRARVRGVLAELELPGENQLDSADLRDFATWTWQ